jgi:hypothetical protein
MREYGIHLMFLEHLVQFVNLQVLSAYGEVVSHWIELYSMNWLRHLEFLHN